MLPVSVSKQNLSPAPDTYFEYFLSKSLSVYVQFAIASLCV